MDSKISWREDPAHLKEWRQTLGITQPELALKSGVSKEFIALIETGLCPFVDPSRTAIWNAISTILGDQLSNPAGMSSTLKFWVTFFGSERFEIERLNQLVLTPAQTVRLLARHMLAEHIKPKEIS